MRHEESANLLDAVPAFPKHHESASAVDNSAAAAAPPDNSARQVNRELDAMYKITARASESSSEIAMRHVVNHLLVFADCK